MAATTDKIATATASDPVSDIAGDMEHLELTSSSIPDPNYVHKPSATPITNLPLPRELRDEIYAYLLDAARISKTVLKTEIRATHQCTAHSHNQKGVPTKVFKFDTSILAANKTISAEAVSYLYDKNAFVEVNYDVPFFGAVCEMARVTKVRAYGYGNVDSVHPRLTVDIAWPDAPFKDMFEGVQMDFGHSGSWIVLLADLPKILEVLRFLCTQSLPSSAVLVTSAQGQRLALHRAEKSSGVCVTATGRSTKYHALTQEEKDGILEDLASVTGAGYAMSVKGLGEAESVDRVLAAAGPRVIWPTALLSQALSDGRRLKKEVDGIAQAGGNASTASTQHAWLRALLSSSAAQQEISASVESEDHPARFLLHRTFILRCDLIFSMADLSLRIGHGDGAGYLLGQLMPQADSLNHEQHWQMLHLKSLVFLTAGLPLDLQQVDSIIEFLTDRLAHTPEERTTHDLGVLQELKATCIGQRGSPAPAKSILDKLSIFMFPFRPYDFESALDSPPGLCESAFIGWQDVKHLSAFDEQDKKAIKAFQEKDGLPVAGIDVTKSSGASCNSCSGPIHYVWL